MPEGSSVGARALVGAVVAAVTLAAVCTAGAVPAPQHVTVIGDSVLTAVVWHDSLAVLERGFDMQIEVAVCRRLTGESCPFEGSRPPTLLQLVAGLGPRLGSTVVVEAGYNDVEAGFAESVEESVSALIGVGVRRILWLTMHGPQPSFLAMNTAVAAAAQRHPELTLLDWSAAAQDHPDWFQNDGIHLTAKGADALAALLNQALVRLFAPAPRPSATRSSATADAGASPAGRSGLRYSPADTLVP